MAAEPVIKMEVVDARLREVSRKLAEIEDRIHDWESLREALRHERKILTDLKDKAVSIEVAGPTLSERLVQKRPGPTEAVMELVEQKPGLTPKEVVDRLEHEIESDSSDRRKLLYTIIGTLQADGRIAKDGGRLRKVEKEVGGIAIE